jgi:hypothetical protein
MESVEMVHWFRENEVLLAWLGGTGMLMFLGSLVAVPVIVAWMPEDYFVRLSAGPLERGPLRKGLHGLKNLLGAFLLLAGLLLLLLPGQGILTMVIGLGLIDFPGKRRLQIRLVRVPRIRNSIQWLRARVHHRPLILPAP